MEKEDKTRVAITAGIAGVILLILVLVIALGGFGKKKGGTNTDEVINASSGESVAVSVSSSLGSSDDAVSENSASEAGAEASSGTSAADGVAEASSGASGSTYAYSEYVDSGKNAVSGNSFYVTKSPVLKDVYKKVKYDKYAQLSEMFEYWKDGNQEAVRDLAHLERFEAMSYSLQGTDDFYYIGDVDSEGKPNGLGLAVYAESQYYFGNFEGGLRSGNGTWISFYPNYSTYVVKEHLYTGQWQGDLPNGQGQEHYDYAFEYMNKEDIYVQNAIGGFSNGLYNGDMYIITVDNSGNTVEWDGICDNGNWELVTGANKDKRGYIPVLSGRDNRDNHIYMAPEKSKNNGITGIITGGSVRK